MRTRARSASAKKSPARSASWQDLKTRCRLFQAASCTDHDGNCADILVYTTNRSVKEHSWVRSVTLRESSVSRQAKMHKSTEEVPYQEVCPVLTANVCLKTYLPYRTPSSQSNFSGRHHTRVAKLLWTQQAPKALLWHLLSGNMWIHRTEQQPHQLTGTIMQRHLKTVSAKHFHHKQLQLQHFGR